MNRDGRGYCRWNRTAALLLALLSLATAVLLGGAVSADEELGLKVGETRLLSVRPVNRVAVGHAGIVDVKVVSPTELLVVAKSEGRTVIVLWPAEGQPVERPVRVIRADPSLTVQDLAAMIDDAGVGVKLSGGYLVLEGEPIEKSTYVRLAKINSAFAGQILNLVTPDAPPPSAPPMETQRFEVAAPIDPDLSEVKEVLERLVGPGLSAENRQGRLLVTGQVDDEAQLATASEVAHLFDPEALVLIHIRTASARQVTVKARIVEIQRAALRELGVEWPREVHLGNPTRPAFGQAQDASFDTVIAKLHIYEQSGKARMLAEPNLIVASGSQGQFLAGGQVPIPVRQESGVTIEWKEYGVKLQVQPVIEEEGLIRLTVRPEVSTLDWANAARVDGSTLPALRTRSAETSVVQRNGGTLVVAGLIQSEEGEHGSQVPWLAQLPLLGRFFRAPRTSSEETELAIFVSAAVSDDSTEKNETSNPTGESSSTRRTKRWVGLE